jgi:hypothetical protein
MGVVHRRAFLAACAASAAAPRSCASPQFRQSGLGRMSYAARDAAYNVAAAVADTQQIVGGLAKACAALRAATATTRRCCERRGAAPVHAENFAARHASE